MDNINKYEMLSEKLKAAAHPHRLFIIKGLMDNECNVSHIQECMKLPQSTISQHLAKLKAAGIIKGTRKGTEICYKVIDDDIKKFIVDMTRD